MASPLLVGDRVIHFCARPLCYGALAAEGLCAEHLNEHQRAEYAAVLMKMCETATGERQGDLMDRIERALSASGGTDQDHA